MGVYQKRPVAVEAVQWHGEWPDHLDRQDPFNPFPSWFWEAVDNGTISKGEKEGHLWIKTLEGGHIADPEDFIIRGIKSELYPCKPDIFKASYDDISQWNLRLGLEFRDLIDRIETLRAALNDYRKVPCDKRDILEAQLQAMLQYERILRYRLFH